MCKQKYHNGKHALCFVLLVLTIALTLFIPPKVQAAEDDLYKFLWLDPDKSVYVLQSKIYKKKYSVYSDFSYLNGLSSDYQDTTGLNARLGFYFHEEWGIEVFYNSYTNKDNDTLTNLRQINSTDPFIRNLKSSMGGAVIWSPFYGKINTFNRIFYFDWSFGLGLASVTAESNKDSVALQTAQSTFKDEKYTGIFTKSDLKFHINEHIHFGLSIQNTSFKAPGPIPNKPETWDHNMDFLISVGFSL